MYICVNINLENQIVGYFIKGHQLEYLDLYMCGVDTCYFTNKLSRDNQDLYWYWSSSQMCLLKYSLTFLVLKPEHQLWSWS